MLSLHIESTDSLAVVIVIVVIVVNLTFIGYTYMLAKMLLLYPCLYAKLLLK